MPIVAVFKLECLMAIRWNQIEQKVTQGFTNNQ